MWPIRTKWSPASTTWCREHSACATLSSTRIGAPAAYDEGSEATPANLSAPREAKRVASSPRPAAKKFTTNAFDCKNAGRLNAALWMQNNSRGGSADTAQSALLVRPRGEPSPAVVVTTVTPVGNEPRTDRNS